MLKIFYALVLLVQILSREEIPVIPYIVLRGCGKSLVVKAGNGEWAMVFSF